MSLYWMERDCSFYGISGNHTQTQTSPPIWIEGSRSKLDGSVSPQSPMSSGSSHCSPTANCSTTTLCTSTETTFPATIRKIRNVRKSDKHHCTVCGDRPTGYHYDVLSCNGCKTFFRRTIINKRSFSCSKGGNCEFTKDFRCACRACRFDKCVRVGMNPSSIQFPSKNNADGEDNDSADEDGNDKSLALVPLKTFTLRDENIKTYRWVDEIFRREDSVQKLRQPGTINLDEDMSLTQLLRKSCSLGIRTADIKPGVLYRIDPVRYWMVADLHLLVEFAKSFEAFQNLDELDQKCLISHIGGVLHVATQSFYSYFESKSATLTFPDGINALQKKMAMVAEDERKPEFSTSFRRIFVQYYTEMYSSPVDELLNKQISMIEYSFFKAISMFSPDSFEMSYEGRAIVNAERSRLTNLLRNYLIAEHGFKNGVARFSVILMAVSTFVTFGEKRRNYISLLNLLEFDLAQLGKDIYLNKPSEMV